MSLDQAVIKFEPFTTNISATFWLGLAKRKLEKLYLDDTEIPIWGYYNENRKGTGHSCLFHITEECLADDGYESTSTLKRTRIDGTIKLFNTIEEFKTLDRIKIMEQVKEEMLMAVENKSQDNFKIATRFKILAFADLKKHHFYYHCIYPSLVFSNPPRLEKVAKEKLLDNENLEGSATDSSNIIEVVDPGCGLDGVFGWPLRNIILWYGLLSYNSLILKIDDQLFPIILKDLNSQSSSSSSAVVTGWEKNEQGIMTPRSIDLSPMIDPKRLAKEAADLNLKLMKWRLMPTLDLDVFFNCKVLLIGAGTLGCNMTRCLLGWGFKNITLIDNGKVSFSNPPRQSLFRFEDCFTDSSSQGVGGGGGGGKPKAETAAQRALEINPSANIQGHAIEIPMPGHRILDKEKTEASISRIHQMIKDHDVLFLLTDSRESRWLPTVLGAAEGKKVITIAIGFDSFVVMRHGTPSNQLGCYFCHDIHAPSDTMTNRTLDQQCTVTRPGVSYMASGVGVELLAMLLQHPLQNNAPATTSNDPTRKLLLDEGSSILGVVPHQIRGYLGHMNMLQLTGEAFKNCTACSPNVIDAFKKDGVSFIIKALENPDMVADVSGASQLHSLPLSSETASETDNVLEFDVL